MSDKYLDNPFIPDYHLRELRKIRAETFEREYLGDWKVELPPNDTPKAETKLIALPISLKDLQPTNRQMAFYDEIKPVSRGRRMFDWIKERFIKPKKEEEPIITAEEKELLQSALSKPVDRLFFVDLHNAMGYVEAHCHTLDLIKNESQGGRIIHAEQGQDIVTMIIEAGLKNKCNRLIIDYGVGCSGVMMRDYARPFIDEYFSQKPVYKEIERPGGLSVGFDLAGLK